MTGGLVSRWDSSGTAEVSEVLQTDLGLLHSDKGSLLDQIWAGSSESSSQLGLGLGL